MKRLVGIGLALAASVLGLAACASSSSTTLINLPDGQPGYAVNCSGSGAGSSWAECYVLAGSACGPSGYDVISKEGPQGAPSGAAIANVVTANIKNRALIVRCH